MNIVAVEQINSYIETLLNPPFERLDLESIGYVKDLDKTNYFSLKVERYYICVKIFETINNNNFVILVQDFNNTTGSTLVSGITINSIQEFNKLIEQLYLK